MSFSLASSAELARICILGGNGYLGNNLQAELKLLGFVVTVIDSRVENLMNLGLKAGDLVLDCSRIRSLDAESMERDAHFNQKLLEFIAKENGSYLRIGSELEVLLPLEVNLYREWSFNRTESLMKYKTSKNFRALLVPNIYGGYRSNSIVDLIIKTSLNREKVELTNPFSFRSFIHIESLVQVIVDFLQHGFTQSKVVTLISTNVTFRIDSIQGYIHTQRQSELITRIPMYSNRLSTIFLKDTLRDDLSQVCTLYSRL
jgi:nucleoside-diphosphate-sugar epimerase